MNRTSYSVLLVALAGFACSQCPTTLGAPEPVASTQTAATAPQLRTSTNDNRLLLGMQMQRAVLGTQDFKEIKRLLGAGFKIDDPIGCGTFNCVDGAVAKQNLEFLRFFLDSGAKPKGSALFQAAWCRDEATSYKMVQMLLKAGANVNYKSQGLTSLNTACYLKHWSVAELLINHPGIDLNYIDTDHRTALMYAARGDSVKIVRLLLEKGVDPGIATPPDPNHGLYEIPRGKTAADFTRNAEIRELLASYKNRSASAAATR